MPTIAHLVEDNEIRDVPISSVIEDSSFVDKSLLTGESESVSKRVGDKAIGGSINGEGVLKVKVERIGSDTIFNIKDKLSTLNIIPLFISLSIAYFTEVMKMKLRFIFPDAKEWRYLIQSLATLIDEANFVATEEGLRLRALDPSRIAMVDLFIPRDAFEEYEIENGEIKIGLNFDDLDKIIRRGKADERVRFEVEENRLRVIFLGRAERAFSLPLLDIAGEELPSPKVTFNVKAKMLSDTLRDALKDAELVSDTIKFIGEESVLKMEAKSDRGEVEAKFSLESGSLLEYDVSEPSSALYGLSYLTDIVGKAYRVSDIATLEFSTNKPLSLSFNVTENGVLRYYLAPRMEA